MATQLTGTAAQRSLHILGIEEAEEQVYRWLLVHSGASVQECAQALPLAPRKIQKLLDTIESKGLATRSPERPRRYFPTSPSIAIEALILERQDKLQRARATAQELQKHAKSAQRNGDQAPMVELITSREAGRLIIEQMDRTARHEILTLIRTPILVSVIDAPDVQDTQRQAQARGVRMRSIADRDYLALPGAVARTRADMKSGEDIRVFPKLPFKMVLADRRVGFLPLNLQQPGGPSLLVRSSALLDALYALFESLWERAAPMSFTSAGTLHAEEPESWLGEGGEDLVSLLAAGLNDKAIANEFDISERTLGRRMGDLMEHLDAATRFQAGWLAALRLSASAKTPAPKA